MEVQLCLTKEIKLCYFEFQFGLVVSDFGTTTWSSAEKEDLYAFMVQGLCLLIIKIPLSTLKLTTSGEFLWFDFLCTKNFSVSCVHFLWLFKWSFCCSSCSLRSLSLNDVWMPQREGGGWLPRIAMLYKGPAWEAIHAKYICRGKKLWYMC